MQMLNMGLLNFLDKIVEKCGDNTLVSNRLINQYLNTNFNWAIKS